LRILKNLCQFSRKSSPAANKNFSRSLLNRQEPAKLRLNSPPPEKAPPLVNQGLIGSALGLGMFPDQAQSGLDINAPGQVILPSPAFRPKFIFI
jgi:hypothetical protein